MQYCFPITLCSRMYNLFELVYNTFLHIKELILKSSDNFNVNTATYFTFEQLSRDLGLIKDYFQYILPLQYDSLKKAIYLSVRKWFSFCFAKICARKC